MKGTIGCDYTLQRGEDGFDLDIVFYWWDYPGKSASLIDGVTNGEGLWKGDARLVLRHWWAQRQTEIKKVGVRLHSDRIFAAIARAWNAFASGNQLEGIRAVESPTRESLKIVGFDPLLYGDVPIVKESPSPFAKVKKEVPKENHTNTTVSPS